jgi:hypothetical protein
MNNLIRPFKNIFDRLELRHVHSSLGEELDFASVMPIRLLIKAQQLRCDVLISASLKIRLKILEIKIDHENLECLALNPKGA